MRLDHLLSKEMERKVDILYSVLSVITLKTYIENQIEATDYILIYDFKRRNRERKSSKIHAR